MAAIINSLRPSLHTSSSSSCNSGYTAHLTQTTAMATRRRCSHLSAAALLLAVCLSLSPSLATAQTAAPGATQSKCQGDMAHLTECMDYATGHEPSPSSTCCGDISDTQKARPECLCYIIQQVHGAGQAHGTQQLGLRFDRVLALPTACKLAGANVSLCISTSCLELALLA